jgi:hypothetical protein
METIDVSQLEAGQVVVYVKKTYIYILRVESITDAEIDLLCMRNNLNYLIQEVYERYGYDTPPDGFYTCPDEIMENVEFRASDTGPNYHLKVTR